MSFVWVYIILLSLFLLSQFLALATKRLYRAMPDLGFLNKDEKG